ncbi:hypothetical protein EC80566_4762, partial [Escherichia coli 8.0566]
MITYLSERISLPLT